MQHRHQRNFDGQAESRKDKAIARVANPFVFDFYRRRSDHSFHSPKRRCPACVSSTLRRSNVVVDLNLAITTYSTKYIISTRKGNLLPALPWFWGGGVGRRSSGGLFFQQAHREAPAKLMYGMPVQRWRALLHQVEAQ